MDPMGMKPSNDSNDSNPICQLQSESDMLFFRLRNASTKDVQIAWLQNTRMWDDMDTMWMEDCLNMFEVHESALAASNRRNPGPQASRGLVLRLVQQPYPHRIRIIGPQSPSAELRLAELNRKLCPHAATTTINNYPQINTLSIYFNINTRKMHLHSDFKFYLGLSIELCTSQVWYSKYACLKERTQEICPYPVQIISTYPSSLPFFPRKCRKMPQPHGVSRSIFHDACLLFIDLSFSHCKKADRFRSCQYVACHQQTPPGTVKDACICLLTFYMLLFSWRIRIAILTQWCIMVSALIQKSKSDINKHSQL